MQTRLFAGFSEDTRQVLQSLGPLRYVEADFALFSAMTERCGKIQQIAGHKSISIRYLFYPSSQLSKFRNFSSRAFIFNIFFVFPTILRPCSKFLRLLVNAAHAQADGGTSKDCLLRHFGCLTLLDFACFAPVKSPAHRLGLTA